MRLTSGERARARLFAETERLRAFVADVVARPGHRFRWGGAELWIDRERLLVLSAYYANVIGVVDQQTAPEDLLNLEGPARSPTPISELIEFLGRLAEGVEPTERDEGYCAEWINLAVIQGMLDPAQHWLCWLILDYGCRWYLQQPFTIAKISAPLVTDVALLPAEREPASARRPAQVAFVRERFARTLEATWETAPAEAWAQRCAEVAYNAKFVFDEIASCGRP